MREVSSLNFVADAGKSLRNESLQRAMGKFKANITWARKAMVDQVDDFEERRERAAALRDGALDRWDALLEEFEVNATRCGATVHWAATEEDARRIAVGIAKEEGCRKAVKVKSMASEEILLNDALEEAGVEALETDLGEYIVQLSRDRPSHIIAPIIHKTREEISELFADKHSSDYKSDPEDLTREARAQLRPHFLSADMGISGANFLLADVGAGVIVTNEGNGRLSTTLPRVHVTIAGIDKILPSASDLPLMLSLLAPSATGQRMSAYVSVNCGPRREGDSAGPESHHFILLDAGRSEILGTAYRDMLRCIRCGACMNHCPVYHKIGGHPYGSPYPGPMGSVLTPLLAGLERNPDPPHAATMCGACEVVCPVKIPLPDLMRRLREDCASRNIGQGRMARLLFALWGWAAMRPWAYSAANRIAAKVLGALGKDGYVRSLPAAGGWFGLRDMPVRGDGAPWLSARKEGPR